MRYVSRPMLPLLLSSSLTSSSSPNHVNIFLSLSLIHPLPFLSFNGLLISHLFLCRRFPVGLRPPVWGHYSPLSNIAAKIKRLECKSNQDVSSQWAFQEFSVLCRPTSTLPRMSGPQDPSPEFFFFFLSHLLQTHCITTLHLSAFPGLSFAT